MKHAALCLSVLPLLAAGALLASAPARAAPSALAAACMRVGNDDTVRPYDPALRTQLAQAFMRLFPHARAPLSEEMLAAQSNIRCMDGRLLACFTGANLPCTKMNADRRSASATLYCRSHPDADFIPAYVVSHDSAYAFRCVGGQARVARQIFTLDQRGFASTLWTPLD